MILSLPGKNGQPVTVCARLKGSQKGFDCPQLCGIHADGCCFPGTEDLAGSEWIDVGSYKAMARNLTEEERSLAQDSLRKARTAMEVLAPFDQEGVDRLCRAVAWSTANERTFAALTQMSVDESGLGSAEGVPARRMKIVGILQDALRVKSVGVIEELPEKGIVKYAGSSTTVVTTNHSSPLGAVIRS